MKTILILLFLATTALADSAWQGPRPAVTRTELPSYVSDAIRGRLNNPASMEIVSWTMPKLETRNSQGRVSGWWYMQVHVRATNVYGGVIVGKWGIEIERETVTRCIQER